LAEDWKVTLNYTYNDGRDISNGGNKPLSELPFHTANGTVDWKATQLVILRQGQLYRRKACGHAARRHPGGYVV
jgi:outer membrane receptor for ferrienterochelin and colicins